MALFRLGNKVKVIGHKTPCVNRQAFIINEVIKGMYYHLFVHGANEDINPVYRVKRGKKTGLFSVDMVITIVHFSITWLSKRKCCSNYENFKKNC